MTNTSQTANPARPTATQGPPLARATVNTDAVSRQPAPGQAATVSQPGMSRIDAAAWLSPRSATAMAARSRPKAAACTAQSAWTTAGEAARLPAFADRTI